MTNDERMTNAQARMTKTLPSSLVVRHSSFGIRHSFAIRHSSFVILLLAAVFYRATSAPIYHLETWDHWKYGEWIWEHKKLPEHEPFALMVGEQRWPLVDTAWLSQVAGYLVYSRAGMEGIALFYGLVEVLKTALYFAAFRRVSGSPWLALLGVVAVQAGLWASFGVFRPQALGEVCWAVVLVASGQWLVAWEGRLRSF